MTITQRELYQIETTLLYCGYDDVVLNSSQTFFFCFGKQKIDPPVGLSIYETNAIDPGKKYLVKKETIQ